MYFQWLPLIHVVIKQEPIANMNCFPFLAVLQFFVISNHWSWVTWIETMRYANNLYIER